MRKVIAAVVVVLLGGCGSGSDGDIAATAMTITGSRLGGSVTATAASGFTTDVSCTTGFGNFAVVVAGNAPQACNPLAMQVRPSSVAVVIGIARTSSSGIPPPLAGGTFQVGQSAFARIDEFGLSCVRRQTLLIDDGTVTVETNDNGTLRGRVDLRIALSSGGGTVTGTFVGNACATPPQLQFQLQQACGGSLPDVFQLAVCAPPP